MQKKDSLALNPNSVFDIFKTQLDQPWENPCVKGSIMFAFAISIRVVQRHTGKNSHFVEKSHKFRVERKIVQ